MELKLERTFLGENYTIGKLYVNGMYLCDTLEDQNRDENQNGKFDGSEKKIYGNTCIPFGRYTVELTFSPRFKRELPILIGVNGFEGVRIHAGNTAQDTEGCILLGKNDIKGRVSNSKAYEVQIIAQIRGAIKKGEAVVLQVC